MSEKSSNGKLGNVEMREKEKKEEKMLTKTASLLQYVYNRTVSF